MKDQISNSIPAISVDLWLNEHEIANNIGSGQARNEWSEFIGHQEHTNHNAIPKQTKFYYSLKQNCGL